MELSVKKLVPDAKLPHYAHADDAGMDIHACEDVTIAPGARATIRTGIAVAIPDGHVGLYWDKSGLANNHGLTIIAGCIDAGYRGELMVTVLNTGSEAYAFAKGEKVTQLLIVPVMHPAIIEAESLPASERGEGRFGSTGK
ncbi:MAG TPA: dUTP diphosphatase [Candidatus Paceibacterota bacterium]|nr:dUTP diphosphatase [Candidatus Paceibacterota bacterium]